jgi:phage tail-like protein
MPRALTSDALRNFKFAVTLAPPPGSAISANIGRLGFMTVDGLGMQTEVIPYREGGDNTTTRKMPGQTDYGPITMSRGSMAAPAGNAAGTGTGRYEIYQWAGLVFSALEGQGTGTTTGDFRQDIYIDVLEHPVTSGQMAAGAPGPLPVKLRFLVFNAWVMALSYSGLDAGGNGVLIESCQLAHEGFQPIYGSINATGPTGAGGSYLGASQMTQPA